MNRRLKPRRQHASENIRNAAKRLESNDLKDNDVSTRIRREREANKPRVFEVPRADLGFGNSIIEPNMEARLPRAILASKLMEFIVGLERGEGVELLPKGHSLYSEGQGVVAPVAVFRKDITPLSDDFVIEPDRVVRFRVRLPRPVNL